MLKRILSLGLACLLLLTAVQETIYYFNVSALNSAVFTGGSYDEILDTVSYLNNNTSNQQQIIAGDSVFSNYAVKTGNIQAKFADGTVDNWVYKNGVNNGAFTYWGRTYKKVYSGYGAYTSVANSGGPSLTYQVKAGTRIEIPVCMPTALLDMLECFHFDFSADGSSWTELEPVVIGTDTYNMYYPYTRTVYSIIINDDGNFRITFPTQSEYNSPKMVDFNSGSMNNGTIYIIPPAAFNSKCQLTLESFDVLSEENKGSGGLLDSSTTRYADALGLKVHKLSDEYTSSLADYQFFEKSYTHAYVPASSAQETASLSYNVCEGTQLRVPIAAMNGFSDLYGNIEFSFAADGKTFKPISDKNISYNDEKDVVFSENKDYARGTVRTYNIRIASTGTVKITLPSIEALNNVSNAVVGSYELTENGGFLIIPAAAFPSKYVLKATEQDIIAERDIKEDKTLDNDTAKYATGFGININKVSEGMLSALSDVEFFGKKQTYVYTPDSDSSVATLEYSVPEEAMIQLPIGMMNGYYSLYEELIFEFSEDGEEYTKLKTSSITYSEKKDIVFSDKAQYAKGSIRIYAVNLNNAGYLRITLPKTSEINQISEQLSGTRDLTETGAIFVVPAYSALVKAMLTVDKRDSITEAMYDTTIVSDKILNPSLTPYAELTGSICGAVVDAWTLKSLKNTEFSGSKYEYFYTLNCYNNTTVNPTMTYRVQGQTRIEFSIGLISAMAEYWNDFKFEYSTDKENWNAVAAEDISFTSKNDVAFSTYAYTKGEIRTYSIEIASDGFVRISFPKVSELAEIAKDVNAITYLRTGAAFVVPAAAFESLKNKSYLAAKPEQSIVSIENKTVKIADIITVSELESLLDMHNMTAEFYQDGKKIEDKATRVISGVVIRCYAGGGTQYEDGFLFDEYITSLSLPNGILITTKKQIENGSFDEINADAANLGSRSAIGSDAFSSYAVYNGTVCAPSTATNWAWRAPNASDMFTIFGKTYKNLYVANRDNTNRYLMYSVKGGTKVRIPLGVVKEAMALLGEFFFEISNDGGVTWEDADAYSIKYNDYVAGTLTSTYTVRIYNVKVENDCLLKITFPEQSIARQMLLDATGNDGVDYQGGYFMVPASGWDINTSDDLSEYQKKLMTVGTYDNVSNKNFKLNAVDENGNPKNNGDCCIDNATTDYVWVEGNVKACATSGWVFAKAYTFEAFDRYYDYVYTPFRSQGAGKRAAIVYRVQSATELQMPIMCPTQYEHIYDEFKFMFSADGDSWEDVSASCLSYDSYNVSSMSTLKYQATVRTYSVQAVKNGYIKIVFPDIDFMFESLQNINNSKNFCDAGSVFICPAAVFESTKGVKLSVKDSELYTKLTENSIETAQESGNKLTISQLIAKMNCVNCYLKVYNGNTEITDENTIINSNMTVKCHARGSLFNEDNEVVKSYSLKVNTVSSLAKPKVVANDDSVVVDDEGGYIRVSFTPEITVNIEKLITMLDFKYMTYKLVDADGNTYNSTAATVGTDTVYMRFYSKGLPYANDGVLLYEYELVGVYKNEELSLASKNLDKVVIDAEQKIIYFKDGITAAEFLNLIRLTGAGAVFYTEPDANFETKLIQDYTTVLKKGMTFALQIGTTEIYYELIPYSAITEKWSVTTEPQTITNTTTYTVKTKGVKSDRTLILLIGGGAVLLLAALTTFVIIIVVKRRKKKH